MIELLIEHEETIAKLYDAYANRFPSHATFWSTLAFEEKDHAKMLRKLMEERQNNNAVYDSTKYDSESIKTSLEYIAEQLNRVENEDLNLINALSVALNIEKAVIDGKVFEAFKGFTKETRSIIRDLAQSVKDHYQVIEKTWSENRKYV
jgi:rubrerythrin